MATAEQMKAYELALREHKSAMGIPLTEIAVFKIKGDVTDELKARLKRDFMTPSSEGTGCYRVAWGFSLTDPKTFVAMFDWREIQDHWDFWQTPAFPPLMACLQECFEPGAPLVRHYKFEPPGMLKQVFIKVLVWDEGRTGTPEDIMAQVVSEKKAWKESTAGFAVDMGQMTWCAAILAYEDVTAAVSDDVPEKGEAHLLKLEFLEHNQNV